MDTKLISKVEKAAGSLCHDANNHLHCYKNWCILLKKLEKAGEDTAFAKRKVEESEARLRAFMVKLTLNQK